jgi:hypothetical protein
MAFAVADRVRETTTTTGTGTLDLGGAVSGFRTFVSGIGDGNVTYYAIVHRTAAEFEIGIGTVTDASTDTLSRTTILSSSNSNSAVSFSAGTKDVFCTQPASKAVFEDNNADVTLPDDLILGSDSAVLKFGADSDTTLTHTDGTGLTLNSTNKLTFNDTGTFIHSNADGDLDLSADGTNADSIKLASSGGITLDAAGDIILDADGDNITIKDGSNTALDIVLNGTTDVTLDAPGDIILDADGGDVFFKDGGTTFGSATNTSGNLIIKSGTTTALTFSGANVTIAGDLTVSGDDITMGTNTAGNLLIADGTNFNSVAAGSLDEISTVANDDVFIAVDTSGGGLKKITRSTIVAGLAVSGTGLDNVVEDTTPQLGGNLDTNDHNILIDDAHGILDDSSNEQLIFQKTSSAVNHYEITNQATGSSPTIGAAGGDSNIDVVLVPKGTGETVIGTGSAAATLTTSGAQDLVLDTNSGSNSSTITITDGSNGNIALAPNGTGVVQIDGTSGVEIQSGAISIKNSGAESYVRFYCESSNAHYTQLQAAPHSAYSGNVTVVLPASADTLVGRDTTDTLTNKTLTTPVIAEIDNSSNITLDAGADIILDADGANIIFKDGGTSILDIANNSSDVELTVSTADKNFAIKGTDGSSAITALDIDMALAGKATFNGAVVVGGDLTVNGTTTTVNSTTVTIDDPIFTLGGDTAPGSDDNKDRGIEFRYHNGSAAKVGFFGFDDSTSKFTFIADATNSSEVFSGSAGNVAFGDIAAAGDVTVGDDLTLESDAAVLNFGADSDVSLTHVADTALLLNSSRQLQFGDSGTYIHQSADGVLDLVSDTEIEINATTIDINGNVEISGDLTVSGDDITMGTNTSGHIMVADGTNFNPVAVSGDVSIAANGAVTIANTAVETAMIAADAITEAKIADDAVESEHINDNVISGQTALTSGLATTDELLISDGGTIKRMDVSVLSEQFASADDVTALAIALG